MTTKKSILEKGHALQMYDRNNLYMGLISAKHHDLVITIDIADEIIKENICISYSCDTFSTYVWCSKYVDIIL